MTLSTTTSARESPSKVRQKRVSQGHTFVLPLVRLPQAFPSSNWFSDVFVFTRKSVLNIYGKGINDEVIKPVLSYLSYLNKHIVQAYYLVLDIFDLILSQLLLLLLFPVYLYILCSFCRLCQQLQLYRKPEPQRHQHHHPPP